MTEKPRAFTMTCSVFTRLLLYRNARSNVKKMATAHLNTFPEPKRLNCPHCAAALTLYDPEGSEYLVCEQCWTYLRWYHDKNALQNQQTLAPIQYEHIIDPGVVGTFMGIAYK